MTGAGTDCEVTLLDRERMNLLGLMLSSMLARRLTDARACRHAHRLRGHVLVEAGAMRIGIQFAEGKIWIRSGPPSERPVASIRGTLTALLDAALGRRRVLHFLRGDLAAWGWPMTLWHMLSLMRIES